jgi:hypothetical protein
MPSKDTRISEHAIQRFCQRVINVPHNVARAALTEIADEGRARSTPRHWTRTGDRLPPDVTYVYHSKLPDVCLLIRGGVVVTVYSRRTCQEWRNAGSTQRRTSPIAAHQRSATNQRGR